VEVTVLVIASHNIQDDRRPSGVIGATALGRVVQPEPDDEEERL